MGGPLASPAPGSRLQVAILPGLTGEHLDAEVPRVEGRAYVRAELSELRVHAMSSRNNDRQSERSAGPRLGEALSPQACRRARRDESSAGRLGSHGVSRPGQTGLPGP